LDSKRLNHPPKTKPIRFTHQSPSTASPLTHRRRPRRPPAIPSPPPLIHPPPRRQALAHPQPAAIEEEPAPSSPGSPFSRSSSHSQPLTGSTAVTALSSTSAAPRRCVQPWSYAQPNPTLAHLLLSPPSSSTARAATRRPLTGAGPSIRDGRPPGRRGTLH
jgi:hypothetical protein